LLRSREGFLILSESGWLARKLKSQKELGNIEYNQRLENSLYQGLNMNQLNSNTQTAALNLQIPIYEHSADLRTELMILKRLPF